MYLVRATELNLRSSPKLTSGNRVGVLVHGHEVEVLDASGGDWWRVRTRLAGVLVEGFVAAAYLVPAAELAPLPSEVALAPVHLLSSDAVSRFMAGRRAFALNEPGKPVRDAIAAPTRAAQLVAIVHWLGVDRHARYLPRAGATYCNIYSYDYCYLGNAYLPRVWWTATAIGDLLAGTAVAAIYGQTVRELNANSLHDWLQEFGSRFGWRREFSLTALQKAANAGAVVLISAQRVDLNTPGHICPVVPENATHRAERSQNGEVRVPLQSNAGSSNFLFGGKRWWTSAKFKSTSFWVND